MKNDLVVFIGRCQIFHNGHYKTLMQALEEGEQVLVILGSANQARDTRNPFTAEERKAMIEGSLTEEQLSRVAFRYIADDTYRNHLWLARVSKLVSSCAKSIGAKSIGLIGHHKDPTSNYLNQFPNWDRISVKGGVALSATDLRASYFEDDDGLENIKHLIPKGTYLFLDKFDKTEAFEALEKESLYIEQQRILWDSEGSCLYGGPFFLTADALVVCGGYILLIKRKGELGKGLWALPGGFVNEDEKIVDTCFRELREETGIKVPYPVLRGSVQEVKIFDDPKRSARGRTITEVRKIVLYDSVLPKIKGADDAEKAKWIAIEEVRDLQAEMFEDHFHIITTFLGV